MELKEAIDKVEESGQFRVVDLAEFKKLKKLASSILELKSMADFLIRSCDNCAEYSCNSRGMEYFGKRPCEEWKPEEE